MRTIRQEYKALKRLQQCSQICKTRGSGMHGGRFYMVLDLLGQNLVEARRTAYGGRMDLATAKVRCAAFGGFPVARPRGVGGAPGQPAGDGSHAEWLGKLLAHVSESGSAAP